MKNKLTVGTIVHAHKAFDIFGSTDKPGSVGLIAIVIMGQLENIDSAHQKTLERLIRRYALTRVIPPVTPDAHPTTEFVPTKDKAGVELKGTMQVDPAHRETYYAELNEAESVEVEVDTPMLKYDDIAKLVVAPNILRAIKPFIEFPASK